MPTDQIKTSSNDPKIPPPSGDSKKAAKYIQQLTDLINQDKITVLHTDLSRFDPSALEDHYRIDLSDYQVEISHSKDPNTADDVYVLLFNNLKQIREGCSEKSILAYMYLDGPQFVSFKQASSAQLARFKEIEDEKRFIQVMSPIDQVLDNMQNEAARLQNNGTNPTAVKDDSEIVAGDLTYTKPITSTEEAEEKSSWPPTYDSSQTGDNSWYPEEHPVKENPNSFDNMSPISNHTTAPHPMDNYLSSASTHSEKTDKQSPY